ncbi:MAG TPA: NEW3 domain-containing protein [Blastocatellia bacterium]|nr:NEW3 domain-containing protein [Blastocatellia bacterium]
MELRTGGRPVAAGVGSRLRVTGRKSGKVLTVESAEVLLSAQSSPAQGEQRQLVMLFNFQDQPTNKPWTPAYINDLIFNQVNRYYQQASYGLTWVTGDLAGWYTIPVNSTDCNANRTQAAEDGARALGYNPDNYSHKIYIYPSTGCQSSGGTTWLSTDSSGNVKTWTYISGSATTYILTHEFGHSLGFRHSNSLSCAGATFGTGCTNVEYGDNYDVMGYYNTGVVNSYHRDLAGWLGTRIQTVTSSGTYTLTPTAVADDSLKAIRIPEAYDPTTGSTTYYYVEYRQPVGYDSFLTSYTGVTSGVLVHLGTIGSDTNKLVLGSQLLDMTPTLTGRNEALAVGKSYYDPAIPVNITVLSADTSGATVSVQFGAPTCTHANPAVAISPSSSQTVAPGASVAYTVMVTNNDSAACVASTFNLQSSVPSGWTASFGSPTLTLSPGGSASTTLTVGSSSSAAVGSYTIGSSVVNGSSPGYSGSAAATLSVASSLGVTVSTNGSSYKRGQSVTMSSNVTAGGSPVAGAAVTFTMVKSNGASMALSATTGSNGSASVLFKIKKTDPPGTYQGKDTATANGLSGGASTTFVVK